MQTAKNLGGQKDAGCLALCLQTPEKMSLLLIYHITETISSPKV